jgi:hypothetical protein
MTLRGSARGCIAVAAVALVAALPAPAKNGARATLQTRVPTKAPAGTTFTVTWIVTIADEHGRRRPFGAGGMFIRLVSPLRGESVKVYATGVHGRYHARVRVPRGGMRNIRLGLRAWVSDPKGTWESDWLLPITNDPFRKGTEPGTGP